MHVRTIAIAIAVTAGWAVPLAAQTGQARESRPFETRRHTLLAIDPAATPRADTLEANGIRPDHTVDSLANAPELAGTA